MAPTVERMETSPLGPYFSIDLKTPELINIDKSDEQSKSLHPDPFLSSLKYVVKDDKIYIFPATQEHWQFFLYLNQESPGRLQSAGMIQITNYRNRTERRIFSYSPSLEGVLSKDQSDQYKNSFLKEALSPYFKVS